MYDRMTWDTSWPPRYSLRTGDLGDLIIRQTWRSAVAVADSRLARRDRTIVVPLLVVDLVHDNNRLHVHFDVVGEVN